jgi:hypothetical protein
MERTKRNSGLGVAAPSKDLVPKAFVVIGINTQYVGANSQKKNHVLLRGEAPAAGEGEGRGAPVRDRAQRDALEVRDEGNKYFRHATS